MGKRTVTLRDAQMHARMASDARTHDSPLALQSSPSPRSATAGRRRRAMFDGINEKPDASPAAAMYVHADRAFVVLTTTGFAHAFCVRFCGAGSRAAPRSPRRSQLPRVRGSGTAHTSPSPPVATLTPANPSRARWRPANTRPHTPPQHNGHCVVLGRGSCPSQE
jgi:hypothetical protein